MSIKTKRLITAIAGVLLFSYGLSIFSETVYLRISGAATERWLVLGGYGLIMVNAGLFILGQSILYQTKLETRKIVKKILRERQKKILSSPSTSEGKPLTPTKMNN